MSALDCLRVALEEVRKLDDADNDKQFMESTLRRLIEDNQISEERKLAKATQQLGTLQKAAVRKKVADEISARRLEQMGVEFDNFSPEQLQRFVDRIEESPDPTVARDRPSVASRMRFLEHDYIQKLNSIFDEYFVGAFNPRSKDTTELSRAMLGFETADPIAQKAAKEFARVNKELRNRLRQAGVYVEDLPHYRPQALSPGRLAKDKDKAIQEMAKLLDPEYHPDPLTSAQAIFETLQTRHTLEPGDQPLTMGRQVHYRTDDPDRLHNFLETYGEDTLVKQIQRQIRRETRALAMAEEFGPDPGRVVKAATRRFREEIARADDKTMTTLFGAPMTQKFKSDLIANGARQTYDALSGTIDTPQNVTAANVSSGVRALMTPLLLGRVALSIIGTDSLIAPLQRARVEGFGRSFSLQAQGTVGLLNPQLRSRLRDYYGAYESMMYMGSPNSRFSSDPTAEGFGAGAQRVSNAVYRATGAWDIEQGLRQATSFSIGRGLGDAAKVPWDELDPRLQQDLNASGVTERVWRDVNKFGQTDEFGLFNWNDLPAQSREAVGSYFHRTLDHSVLRPDSRVRAILFAGGRRGSLPGELAAAVTQFLNWPIQFTRVAMLQQAKKGVPGFAVFSGALFAGGMVTEQLYALTSGEPMFEWDSTTLATRAARRSGLMTPIGEWAYGGLTKDRFMQPGLGPVFDTTMSLLGSAGTISTRVIEGETDKAAAEAIKAAERLTPNVSWFDATVIQPSVQSAIQSLNPDVIRRQEQRFKDEERVGF